MIVISVDRYGGGKLSEDLYFIKKTRYTACNSVPPIRKALFEKFPESGYITLNI